MLSRRQFLTLAAIATATAACGQGPTSSTPSPGPANPLRIPPLLQAGADGRFTLTMKAGTTEFVAGKPAPTWGFNGSYLGPTIRARRGDRIRMRVVNELDEPTTVHWHGMRLPAKMDGGPHQMIPAGGEWTPEWTIDQPAATSWYHPHPHGETARHVYRGLAGMFLLDDDDDKDEAAGAGLPGEYGVDDIPLVIQDRVIGDDGTLVEDPVATWGLMGDRILVNGTLDAAFQVTRPAIRFRLLNGSNARKYNIGFADGRAFHVVGGDAGLLRAPVQVTRVSLTPGERIEIVATFKAGEQALLRSFAGDLDLDDREFDLLRLDAAPGLEPAAALPATLSDRPAIEVPAGAKVRRFTLNGSDAINGQEMDMTRIDEVVPAGAVEIWEIVNTVYAHNFHIHEVEFAVLDVDGAKPEPYLAGPKDTVYVPPKATVRLAVRFGEFVDPATPYMYHCHILRHEDEGMMGQFVIVTPGTEAQVNRTLPATHQHA
ncbi:multicopper oxidase domain-containing protein [Nonomuraea sp. NPDC050310]|uniref:multicopper oxidase family protein n=1 Tax=Nonomuraea sp. NPDC050310 TaxID=3154935 RepID=UPI0033E6AC57